MREVERLIRRHGHMPRTCRGSLLWLEHARPYVTVKHEALPRALAGYAVRLAFKGKVRGRIVLNSVIDDTCPWITLAHELGHIELGILLSCELLLAGSSRYWERRMERDADAFAAELLIPWEEVCNLDGLSLIEAAEALAVSERMIVARFGQL